jgi:hypothetical protein
MSLSTVERDTENRQVERRPGRLVNRSAALARHRESLQLRRSTIADWTTSMDAPREQLDQFDTAIGDLHHAVALGNHAVWGDPLPHRLEGPSQRRLEGAVQLTPDPSAPNRSTPDGGAASDQASYARPPARRSAPCPEVNANFDRAVAQSNLRHLLEDLFALPQGGTGDQVALRDERGRTQIVSRASALASRRRVEAELRQRIGHLEGDLSRLREMLRTLRGNNQDTTNPIDYPSAERQVATLERRIAELHALLARQNADAWSSLTPMIDAASQSAQVIHRFITEHIVEDTPGAELARTALRAVRNSALAVFTAAAIVETGGLAGVALAGGAGATFEAAEQVSEVGHQGRQRVSGAEIGAAALYAMVDAALQALMGTRGADRLAVAVMARAERLLLAEGLSPALARDGARRVASEALSRISSTLQSAADAGVARATGVRRDQRTAREAQGTATGVELAVRRPGTALRNSGVLPDATPDALFSALDQYGLDRQLEAAATSFVRGQAKRASENDQARMNALGHESAVSRAGAVRDLARPVQRRAASERAAEERAADVHTTAAEGLSGRSSALPFAAQIQKAFGRHDVSSVSAHVDGAAKKANRDLGALAYASGDAIAFGQAPDLHTAAHEAAHIVQQRAGLSLSGGVGEEGDRHERHADEVARRVVQGRSAEDLLDAYSGRSRAPTVQRRPIQFDGIGDHLRQVRDGLRHPLDTVRGHRQWERQRRDRQASTGAMDSEPETPPTWFSDLKNAVSTARSASLSFATGLRAIANAPATATSDALNSEANHLATVERVLDHPTLRAGIRTYSGVQTVSLIARIVHLHDSARDAQQRYLAEPDDQNQRAFAVAMTSYINAVGELAGSVPGLGELAGGAVRALTTVNFLNLSRVITSMGVAADPYRRGGSRSAEMGDTPLPD